jgi:HAD superfamily hydrolase (TIGR01490 family)
VLLSSASVEAAFFDLDKTVIAKASMVAFGRPLLRAGMISRRLMVRALWSQLVFSWFGANEEKMRKFRESALRITRGWDQARIRQLVADNLTEVIEPIVYEEALVLIREHQRAERSVYIVSASPEEVVEPLGAYLGVDGVIATQARIDDDGRYTGEVEFYSSGPYKAEAMREVADAHGIDLAGSYAYSDSATDRPMLEAVGHPVAVNPDRELARTARERGWEVQIFRIGVPLRERVPMPPPRHTAVVAGVATATVGAVALWWLIRREPPPPPRRRSWKPGRGSLRSPAASSPRRRQGRGRR